MDPRRARAPLAKLVARAGRPESAGLRPRRPPIVFGLEKSGTFAEHGNAIARHIPEETLMKLDDDFVERYITFRDSPHGKDTYYGRQHAGIPNFSPHDLRHRRVTIWHHEGIPARVLAERAGHSKASMTLDTYSHVLDPGKVPDEELQALL